MTEILSLDTFTKRKRIRINLKRSWWQRLLRRPAAVRFYELRNVEELSAVAYGGLARRAAEVERINPARGEVTAEELALLDQIVNESIDALVIDMPRRVRDQLSILQRVQIVEAWSNQIVPPRAEGEALAPRIGAPLQRDFSTSTAATPTAG